MPGSFTARLLATMSGALPSLSRASVMYRHKVRYVRVAFHGIVEEIIVCSLAMLKVAGTSK